jgi:hypothetical protein
MDLSFIWNYCLCYNHFPLPIYATTTIVQIKLLHVFESYLQASTTFWSTLSFFSANMAACCSKYSLLLISVSLHLHLNHRHFCNILQINFPCFLIHIGVILIEIYHTYWWCGLLRTLFHCRRKGQPHHFSSTSKRFSVPVV